MEEYTGQNKLGKTYIIVVNNEGDTNILNLSYDFNWQDVSVMLQVKFDFKEVPRFTYTDQEEDTIVLDSQEAFEEALKVAKQNSDVLHVQMRERKTPAVPPRKSRSCSSDSSGSIVRTTPHVELARAAVDDVVDWASKAVRSVFNSTPQAADSQACTSADISMQSVPAPAESLSVDNFNQPEEVVKMPTKTDSETRPAKDSKLRKITVKEIAGTSSSGKPSSVSNEQNSNDEASGPSTSLQHIPEETQTDTSRDEILQKIKEEVRMAISQELSLFRNELRASVLQNPEQRMWHSTANLSFDGPRSPSQIKGEIKSLREEMKAARELKKLNQQARSTSPNNAMTEITAKQTSEYAASLICENLLNENCVSVGQQFVKYWVLKNEGTAKWTHLVELKLLEETPEKRSAEEDSASVKSRNDFGPDGISAPVPPTKSNGIAVIAVTHTAPNFPCTYASAWRLSHNGRPFGPRICCSVYVSTRGQLLVGEQPSMSLLSSMTSSHTAEYSLESSQCPSSLLPSDVEVMKPHDRKPPNVQSIETSTAPEFKAEANALPDQVHAAPTTHSTAASKEQQAEDSSEEDDIYRIDQPQSQDTVERDSFEEAISGFTSLDINDEANVVDHVTRQNEEEASVSEGEEEVSNDANQERRLEESDVDDSSSMMSDFEVVPLPGCFDTTKPLTELESPADEDEEKSSSLQSNSTLKEEEHTLPTENSEPNCETREEEDTSGNDEEEIIQSKEIEDFSESLIDETEAGKNIPLVKEENSKPLEEIASTSSTAQSSSAQLVVPRCIPIPQPDTDVDKPFVLQTPLSVPQPVLDLDKPYPVTDYAKGYKNSPQKTVSVETPWSSPPIPLPRGVLDANKPWVKENPTTGVQSRSVPTSQPLNATPPQPHSATVPQPRSVPTPQPLNATPPQPHSAVVPQPRSVPTPQPLNAIPPKPQSAAVPQPRSVPTPQPLNAIPPQPHSAAVPQPRSVPIPQPLNAIPPQPHSAAVPQPRSATNPQLSTHSSERAWDARLSLESSISSCNPDVESNSPHIYYPPVDNEEAEEYILAPEPEDSTTQVRLPSSPTNSHQSTQHNPETHDFLPFTPGPMEQLIDMGFCDIDMNKDLLAAFQGDLSRVINALVYKGGDDNSLPSRGYRNGDSFIA